MKYFTMILLLSFYLVNAFSQLQPTYINNVFSGKKTESEFIQFIELRCYMELEKEKIKITNSSKKRGKLKKEIDISIEHVSSAKQVTFSILDENLNVLLIREIPHPLLEAFEYSEGEQKKVLKRISAELVEKHFLIRLPYSEKNAFIKFEHSKSKNGSPETIAFLKLN